MDEFLAWYLASWRRMGRGTFNLVVGLATLPGAVLSLTGMVDGAGGMFGQLASFAGMQDGMRKAMAEGVSPDGVPDVAALQATLDQLQGGEAVVEASGGMDWAFWGGNVDLVVWLALIPLVHMRLRDVGVHQGYVWVWTGVVYAGMVMGFVDRVAGPTFGMASMAANVVGFLVLGWLCMAKSVVTEGGSSGRRLDDVDPYPPFRP